MNDSVLVPPVPSVTEASAIEIALPAPSSSTIVTAPEPSPIDAFTAFESSTENASSDSSTMSPSTSTLTLCDVSPGANVTVPDLAVKSLPAVAVPARVA